MFLLPSLFSSLIQVGEAAVPEESPESREKTSGVSSLLSYLRTVGQEELALHLENLGAEEQEELAWQLQGVEVAELQEQVAWAGGARESGEVAAVAPCQRAGWRSEEGERRGWEEVGRQALCQGQVGVILMAGGQGTRLGSKLPKALYDLGLPSRKSLLHLQAERLLSLERAGCGARLPWYIMVSQDTVEPIRKALEKHHYYGLKEEQVVLFTQGNVPCLSPSGSLLLSSPTSLATSPDGNGGLLASLSGHGVLEDMRSRGIQHVFLYSVDNVLVRPADPVFMGFCMEAGAEVGTKVVEAREDESVGLVGLLGGQVPGVLEYSEAAGVDTSVKDGNTCIHYLSIDFLERAVQREAELPMHIARKKIPTWDPSTASLVQPSVPNGIKLEKFIFDCFRFVSSVEKFVVYEVLREEEFAPLKSSEGKEATPGQCREALLKLHATWLVKAGAELLGPELEKTGEEDDTSLQLEVEISPLVSYSGEGLQHLVQGREMVAPLHLTQNKTYF